MSARSHRLGGVIALLVLVWIGYGRLSHYLAARAGGQAFTFGIFDLLLPILICMMVIQIARFAAAPKSGQIRDPSVDIVIEDWAVVGVIHLLFGLALVFGGLEIVVTPLWKLVCIGLGTCGLLRLASIPKSRFVLSRTGIEYSEVHPAEIAWDDIAAAEQAVFITTPTIVLRLREAGKFRPASLLTRWRHLSKIRLYGAYFGIDTADLFKGVEARRQAFTFVRRPN
jgi:hypothetical protein